MNLIINRKPSSLDFTEEQWIEWVAASGASAFSAKQIMRWIFKHHVLDPARYTNISLGLRQRLLEEFDWTLPGIDTVLQSSDGSEKLLLKTRDGRLTESVLMPINERLTLCVSCQVGCRMGCTFCQTGRLGFGRNLSSGEILAQLVIANLRLMERGEDRRVTNVVFMGMGEPLDNYEAVVESCRVMLNTEHFGLSRHRVTVSTSGLVPEVRQLGKDLRVSLAISLHCCDDTQRSEMMPINKKYPLSELKQALLEYQKATGNCIMLEYVMIDGENDTIDHAKKLVKFAHGLRVKVNLIPMNAYPGSAMRATDPVKLRAFQTYLADRSIPAPVRYSHAQDISGACGQLAAKRQAEINLPPQVVSMARRREARSENACINV